MNFDPRHSPSLDSQLAEAKVTSFTMKLTRLTADFPQWYPMAMEQAMVKSDAEDEAERETWKILERER